MPPEIHTALKNQVCALIRELGATLDHLDTLAEISRLPDDSPQGRSQRAIQAELFCEASTTAASAAEHAHELAEDIDRLHRAASASCTHEADEAEDAP